MCHTTASVRSCCWTRQCAVHPYASSTSPSTRSPSSPSSWARPRADWSSSRWRGMSWVMLFLERWGAVISFSCYSYHFWGIYRRLYAHINSIFFSFSNQISELSLPLCLAELKVLDVSKNQVKMVSDNFLSECVKMETFIASVNQISKSANSLKQT